MMNRAIARTSALRVTRAATLRPAFQVRTMADKKSALEEATQAAGEAKDTNPKVGETFLSRQGSC